MDNLRFLDLSNVHLSHGLTSLPKALKVLRWNYCALKALPGIEQLYQLGVLQLCNSRIRKLWNGTPSLHKLRIIDLSGSKDLIETPDFSETPNIERMFLNDCINLIKVHESVGQLKKLLKLSLKGCKNLVTLPSKLETNSLQAFTLFGCSKLEKLPEFGKNMKSLYIIDVEGTSIREAPWSIIHLTNLKHFELGGWHRLWSVIPEIPKNLIIYADRCLSVDPSVALQHTFALIVSQNPRSSQGPTHLLCKDIFLEYQGNLIPSWFEQREYILDMYEHPLFRKKKIRSGSVSITTHIPYDVTGYRKTEWSAIAVCLVVEKKLYNPATWSGFSIIWKFKDYCHPSEERHGRQKVKNPDFIPLYIGLFPFEKKHCPRHPTGGGCQVGLTITISKLDLDSDEDPKWRSPLFRNLRVLECGWRLMRKKDLDA
ncbi:TMV resistance protein N-like [Senna tora]|uniref:TMV resistance protein N-like n=1 Tax=Senna tora TaxID=362788 RepID=A0A834WA29_9FABA|nr:TMV resistance protein N-like [Senna tora]